MSILVAFAGLLVASPCWAAGPPLSAYTLYGENGVFIGAGSTIDGLVGGKNALPGDAQNASIRLAGGATINGDARSAHNVVLANNAHITGEVIHPAGTSVILGAGASVGTNTVGDPQLPALPPATNITAQCTTAAAAADVVVSNGQTHTFTPGIYGDVIAGGSTTLVLNGNGGPYVFNSISAGNGTTLSIIGATHPISPPITIFVCDFARFGGVTVLPATLTETDLKIEVHHVGANAFRAAGGSNWIGDVFAPFGQIHFGGSGCCSFFAGRFVAGLDINIEHAVQGHEGGVVPGPFTKSGLKFNDANGNGVFEPLLGETPLGGWVIHIFDTATNGATFHTHVLTDAVTGMYTVQLAAGTYTVCEELQAGWTQTAPITAPPGESLADCTTHNHFGNPGPVGYTFTIGANNLASNDFGNQFACAEDVVRAGLITRLVGLTANPASVPPAYDSLQAAYDAALVSGNANEVIGMFTTTPGNVVLGGNKANIVITQCTLARITATNASQPVWTISNSQKLTIIGPDAVGGADGWLITTNGHDIRGIRANGASGYGIRITGNNNSVSVNSVSGNQLGGIRVEGDNNTLRPGGSVSANKGNGVELAATASGNIVSIGRIQSNLGNGIRVDGPGNTVKDNGRVDLNQLNGILVNSAGNTIKNNAAGSDKGKGNNLDGFRVLGSANTLDSNKANANGGVGVNIIGANNQLKNNQSNQTSSGGTKENTGAEYCFADGTTRDLGSNKKDTLSFLGTIGGVPNRYATGCFE